MDTAAPLIDLARVKRTLGDFDGEIAAMQRSVTMALTLRGPTDTGVVLNHIELARRLADRDRHAECLTTLVAIAESMAAALGEAHPAIGDAGLLRLRALRALGRHDEAAAAAATHLAWCRQHVGADDPRTRHASELVSELAGGK
jgi:hypothetical protein